MDLSDIEKIVKMLRGSDISEFVLEQEGSTVKICRGGIYAGSSPQIESQQSILLAPQGSVENLQNTSVSEKAADEDEGLIKVDSPIVGTFYSKPSPDADAFVNVGDRVKKGEKLCIVEAMKLMNEIESPVSGVVEKISLTDGQVVEYGEVLFLIREA